MTYGLDSGLFIEDGPAIHAARTASTRRINRFRTWGRLDTERRFELVESALRAPANDLIDTFPVAL